MPGFALAEDILPVHERAVRDQLKPGGRVISASGRIRVALVEDINDEEGRIGVADGFGLSPFNCLGPRVRRFTTGHERLTLHGEAADIFAFEFVRLGFCVPASEAVCLRASGGPINGVAQRIALQLDDETVYENRPRRGAKSCWALAFYPLSRRVVAEPGQEIGVCGSYERRRISVWGDA